MQTTNQNFRIFSKPNSFIIIPFIAILSTIASSCGEKKKKAELTIAVAANVQYAMQDLQAAYEKKSGEKISVILGSSGKLTAQIQNGAPYHVFLAADTAYPDNIIKSGQAVSPPLVYAKGSIVFWTNEPNNLPADSSALAGFLKKANLKKIALANPRVAPYGEQTVNFLKKNGIYNDVKDNLVYGENLSQVNQFVISKAASGGFTAKSVVLSPAMKGKGRWLDLPSSDYEPIEQAMVILKKGSDEMPEQSKNFFDFIMSDEATAIFEKYGYSR